MSPQTERFPETAKSAKICTHLQKSGEFPKKRRYRGQKANILRRSIISDLREG
jgi:hypothetical protein